MNECYCNNFSEPIQDYDQMVARHAIPKTELFKTFDKIKSIPNQWVTIYKCRVCGTLFVEEYPFSQMHGGGGPFIYKIETDNLDDWLNKYESLSGKFMKIKSIEYDKKWFQSLGPELGKEICSTDGCKGTRIAYSSKCRKHHYEMVKGKTYNEND